MTNSYILHTFTTVVVYAGGLSSVTGLLFVVQCLTVNHKLETSTHKSAKTHAGSVFVTRDLDLQTPK